MDKFQNCNKRSLRQILIINGPFGQKPSNTGKSYLQILFTKRTKRNGDISYKQYLQTIWIRAYYIDGSDLPFNSWTSAFSDSDPGCLRLWVKLTTKLNIDMPLYSKIFRNLGAKELIYWVKHYTRLASLMLDSQSELLDHIFCK